MQTFATWKKARAKAIAAKYHCTVADALQCVDNWRWYREHVQPMMREGHRPSVAVARSLAMHCPYSPAQLMREFLSYGHGDSFWPTYCGLDGRIIAR